MQFVKKISLNRSSRSILMFKSRKKKKRYIHSNNPRKKMYPLNACPKHYTTECICLIQKVYHRACPRTSPSPCKPPH